MSTRSTSHEYGASFTLDVENTHSTSNDVNSLDSAE